MTGIEGQIKEAKEKRDKMLLERAKFEIKYKEVIEQSKTWDVKFKEADDHYEYLLAEKYTLLLKKKEGVWI